MKLSQLGAWTHWGVGTHQISTAVNEISRGICLLSKQEFEEGETESQDMSSSFDNSLDLAKFAFSPTLHSSSLGLSPTMPRRSSRRPVPKLKQEDSDGLSHFSEAEVKPQKRSAVTVFGEPSPKKSPKKPKRTYAMPDKYAHLTGLPDWLKEELDGRPYIVHT